MIEIGIPVYNAKDTLPATLDSLVSQTYKNFSVCLSIDGDGVNYSKIIRYYKRRLKIRIIKSKINEGPGAAREKILATTKSKYIAFVDADDILTSRAIELYIKALEELEIDLVEASFVKALSNGQEVLFKPGEVPVTWFHGKAYRVSYLKEHNLHIPNLRAEEDAQFNLMAFNANPKRGYIDEILYVQQYNKNSITRKDSRKIFITKNYFNYALGQINGLKFLFDNNYEVKNAVIMDTLTGLYDYHMQVLFYGPDQKEATEYISKIFSYSQVLKALKDKEWWKEKLSSLPTGVTSYQYDDDDNTFIIYKEDFETWLQRFDKSFKLSLLE